MNKGESRKGEEMSDMVKAKRQEISAQHPGELEELQKECSEEDRMAHVDAQKPTTD